MAFSGALTITDLDDFLTPSQACIIPVRNSKGSTVANEGSTEIHIDADNTYYEVSTYSTSTNAGPSVPKAKQALEKAEINLNDCLACSGCITSTESILITMQSHNEVLDFISRASSSSSTPTETRTPLLSISPQTLASLSAAYSSSSARPPIPLLTLLRRIRHFLRDPRRGGWRVWDTTFSRHLSLRESVREFEERKATAKGPILVSACPGWVCYAEKAQGEMLPMLSSVRSAQGIMGGLVKTWWAAQMQRTPDQVYHVTAMPCYDKKLEASRSDFFSSIYNTRDVDCVLTTGELDLLLQDLAFDPYVPTPGEDEVPETRANGWGSPFPELLTPAGSSSGSYLQTILSHVAAAHLDTHLTVRPIRDSPDNVEYILSDASGEVLFKGAKVYGFRNLQNLVRKVQKETGLSKRPAGAAKLSAQVAARRRKARATAVELSTPATPASPAPGATGQNSNGVGGGDIGVAMRRLQNEVEKKLDYVEVMACPGGCVNGGGQMKPPVASAAGAGAEAAAAKGAAEAEVKRDEEGYERPMEVDGVASGVEEGMRWSTKEWVGKVEEIYWSGGLPTPPPSPPRDVFSLSSKGDDRAAEANLLADRVVSDVAGGDEGKRWEFLRTRFRKVEGDILNGGVTLDAVKW